MMEELPFYRYDAPMGLEKQMAEIFSTDMTLLRSSKR